ncbi:MAG TPA: hypothetical protein VHC43_13000 [Mycobacteriales bacterium]|nr:hypothetical protein [Mycobacteriales bacterium]
MDVISWAVDRLPERLWSDDRNLWIPRYGERLIGHWHLCVGARPGAKDAVRTVERNGNTLLYGARPFNFDEHDPGLHSEER